MTAWTLDIRVPNTLEVMANKTARALKKVSKSEETINKFLAKGLTRKKQDLSLSTKAVATQTKRAAGDKKHLSFTEKLSKNYLAVRDAVTVAFRAAKAMTIDAIEKSSELDKTIQAMKFEIDLFSSGTASGSQFKELQKFANQTKVPVKELTDEWLKFRKASTPLHVVSNAQAGDLLKVWADIRAISQSSEVASKVTDEWITKFAEGPDVAARFLQQVKGAHKEWKNIGTGEFAKSIGGPLAAEDKMDAAKNKMLQALKPLSDLMNELKAKFADFLSKVANSKGFHNFIAGVADSIRWMVDKGLPELGNALTKFAATWKSVGEDIKKSGMEWFDKIADGLKKTFDAVNPMQILKDIQQRIEAPAAPAPQALPGKHGFLQQQRAEKQLAGITIQNLNVNGSGANADQIARSVRQEMQLLLQAGALSKGYA
jgi:hypothetical protein